MAEPQQVDDGVFALGSDRGVLVLGVVQQALQQGLHQAGLQDGSGWLSEHPPQHSLRYQPDVTGLVLKTLWGARGQNTSQKNIYYKTHVLSDVQTDGIRKSYS